MIPTKQNKVILNLCILFLSAKRMGINRKIIAVIFILFMFGNIIWVFLPEFEQYMPYFIYSITAISIIIGYKIFSDLPYFKKLPFYHRTATAQINKVFSNKGKACLVGYTYNVAGKEYTGNSYVVDNLTEGGHANFVYYADKPEISLLKDSLDFKILCATSGIEVEGITITDSGLHVDGVTNDD